MSEQEQWIDSVFESIEHIARATPQRDLLGGIMAQLPQKKARVVSLKRLAWIAVAASVIIAINVYVLNLNSSSVNDNQSTDYEQIALVSDYSLYQ